MNHRVVNPAEVLFEPLSIGPLNVSNRIVMGPMAVLAPEADGRISDQTIAVLGERAAGGVGMIILGGTGASRRIWEERPFPRIARLDDDRFLPDLRRLTDAIHAEGVPIIAELVTGFGPMAKPAPGWDLIAASPKGVVIPQEEFPKGMIVPGGRVTPTPREATVEEIKALEHETVAAALRCRRAGFDGIEVGAHMSYLMASFLSPRTNWRTDEYGGSVENRARMLANVVRAIREHAGPSFVIGLRISGNEHVEGGQGPEGFAAIAQVVEREGLDYVALSDGNYASMRRSAPDIDGESITHGEAQAFRAALSCRLILGSIHDPQLAAEAIADGHGDAVMFARQLLADPRYADKVRAGDIAGIVRCDRRNECMRRMVLDMEVRCTRNPRMGRESRPPGAWPPARRLVKAPIERAVLAATGSERLMAAAGRFAARKKR